MNDADAGNVGLRTGRGGAQHDDPVGISTVYAQYGALYAQQMALALLGALPPLVVFLLFQRQIVQGIANTGLKG